MDTITIADYLPVTVQQKIPKEDWDACLDAWTLICHEFLTISSEDFRTQVLASPSLLSFLTSYVAENAGSPKAPDSKGRILRSKVFLLVHRLFSGGRSGLSGLLAFEFLSDFSIIYQKSPSLPELLTAVWTDHSLDENASLKKNKAILIQILEDHALAQNKHTESRLLLRVAALLKSCYPYGRYLLAGSDLLDALSSAYATAEGVSKKKIRVITYRSLHNLVETQSPQISTLIDHLYSLKASGGPILQDLCAQTPLLQKIRATVVGADAARAQALLQELGKWEVNMNGRPKKSVHRKIEKGKGKEAVSYGHGSLGNIHVHKMSFITQVQDIFPDLGTAFVAKLLDEYDNNIEQVTSHLLEDSLPDHLRSLDRSENLPPIRTDSPDDPASRFAPRTSPPQLPIRRNVFDDDDFSRLAISPSQVHYGRAADDKANADTLLDDRTPTSAAKSKAAILSALAAFDTDDDERDDTYDADDVGGTVDISMPGSSDDVLKGEDKKEDVHEEALFRAWKMSPEIFERDAATRRSKARTALIEESGMSNEMIEGWAVMLKRDPGRLRRLEAKFSATGVSQRELGKSSWQASEGETDDDRVTLSGPPGRGRGGSRGRARGGRGNVAGPANDTSTQQARQKKDQNKGSRANHNRRDQRAKKVARGGFPG